MQHAKTQLLVSMNWGAACKVPMSSSIQLEVRLSCCAVFAGLPTSSSERPEALDFDSYSRTTSASAAQPRLKGETTDERKQRKAAVKDAKVPCLVHIVACPCASASVLETAVDSNTHHCIVTWLHSCTACLRLSVSLCHFLLMLKGKDQRQEKSTLIGIMTGVNVYRGSSELLLGSVLLQCPVFIK